MQKFTIFTIIFAVIVLSITAELVTKDYLAKLYPPNSSANLLATVDDPALVKDDSGNSDEADEQQEDPETAEEDSASGEDFSPLEQISEAAKDAIDNTKEAINFRPSEAIMALLPAIDLPGLKYEAVNFNGKLFDLFAVDELDPDDVSLGTLVVESGAAKNLIGAFYEFPFEQKSEARRFYSRIKAEAREASDIDTNETNQFGESSFYINHKSKVAQVFLVAIKDDKVYAFAYKNEYHETMKPFLGLLL